MPLAAKAGRERARDNLGIDFRYTECRWLLLSAVFTTCWSQEHVSDSQSRIWTSGLYKSKIENGILGLDNAASEYRRQALPNSARLTKFTFLIDHVHPIPRNHSSHQSPTFYSSLSRTGWAFDTDRIWLFLERCGTCCRLIRPANVEPEQTIPEIWREKLLLWVAIMMIPISSVVFVFVVRNVVFTVGPNRSYDHISFPSSKSTFSQLFEMKCQVVKVGSIIIFHLSKICEKPSSLYCVM